MKKRIIIIITILALGALFLILRGNEDAWLCQNGQWVKHGNPSATMPTSGCGTNINTSLANPASGNCESKGGKAEIEETVGGQIGICVFSDDTRCEEWAYFRGECQPGGNIIVFSPIKNSTVNLPFKVSGQARVFENQLNLRIKDVKGNILLEKQLMSTSPEMGIFGDFETEITALDKQPEGEDILVEVLDFSAKDGSEIDLVSIPLKLAK
ncbi:MAG: DUF333 domain-containing protein [Patescibacteria group bacterium]